VVPADLGISESCLRRWMAKDHLDAAWRGVSSDERRELVELRWRTRMLEIENKILKRASAYFARENVLPKIVPVGSWLLAEEVSVAVACRVLGLSSSCYYK